MSHIILRFRRLKQHSNWSLVITCNLPDCMQSEQSEVLQETQSSKVEAAEEAAAAATKYNPKVAKHGRSAHSCDWGIPGAMEGRQGAIYFVILQIFV